ncbi:MAG: ATP-binding protein [Pseudomonadota bacterium]
MSKPFCCAITIRSETRYLSLLRRMVEVISTKGLLDRKAVIACSMALVEAVDNAVIHAHKRKKSLPIKIAFSVNQKEVVMDVVDMGSGISQLNPPEPDAMSCHGRGLFVINRAMTSVTSRVNNGFHELRMVYRI